MQRSVVLASVAFTSGGLVLAGLVSAPAARAQPHTAPTFTSCAQVNGEYAGGVARTERAADRAVRAGFLRPIVCPTAYGAGRALDRDRDGVICERRAP